VVVEPRLRGGDHTRSPYKRRFNPLGQAAGKIERQTIYKWAITSSMLVTSFSAKTKFSTLN